MSNSSNLLVQFDDLTNCINVLTDTTCEHEFKRFLIHHEANRGNYANDMEECKRLKGAIDAAMRNISSMDVKLNATRKMMYEEKKTREAVERDRDSLLEQLQQVRRILLSDPRYVELPSETRERLSFLDKSVRKSTKTGGGHRTMRNLDVCMATVGEEESDRTASFLSESSFSCSDNTLDDSAGYYTRSKKRSYSRRSSSMAFADENAGTVRRKKSAGNHLEKLDTIDDDPLVSIEKTGFTPSAPQPESGDFESGSSGGGGNAIGMKTPVSTKRKQDVLHTPFRFVASVNSQAHDFEPEQKWLMTRQTCSSRDCKGGKNSSGTVSNKYSKCKYCHVVAHDACVSQIPKPCIPINTPKKGVPSTVTNCAPLYPPCIPAVVVYCINEIEKRGLFEVGLYRVPGPKSGIDSVNSKFAKKKCVPNLSEEAIPAICSYMKDFLRNLSEPLIPSSISGTFEKAITTHDVQKQLGFAVSVLPRANQETLTFLMLHLKKVIESPECKMSADIMAEVFADVIFGYPLSRSSTVDRSTAVQIVERMLAMSTDFWNNTVPNIPSRNLGMVTPGGHGDGRFKSRTFTPKSGKYFKDTPPYK